jgi:Ca-activated chloride channel family protein
VLALVLSMGCSSSYHKRESALSMQSAPSVQAKARPPALGLSHARHYDSESYAGVEESGFRDARVQPLSTFSIDMDTASYANVRRFLDHGQLPPPDAVRIEEMINYFSYEYPAPADGEPLGLHGEVASCPWAKGHRLVLTSLKARGIDEGLRPPANLTFLLDVSGSMDSPDKLPLLVEAMKLLVRNLGQEDRVAIVTYADHGQVHLPSTPCTKKGAILSALDELVASGSTNGASGLRNAYKIARGQYDFEAVNRVILATDGDFNVGQTEKDKLVSLIRERAGDGIYLTVLGLGTGNLQDDRLEALADKGNGAYAYLDSFNEAYRVLVAQATGTLVTVAKDVKVQVEFNPAQVTAYRLIGYENRLLTAQDFTDDERDAGEMGAGQSVTALYEVIPVGASTEGSDIEALRYQTIATEPLEESAFEEELMTLKVRFKEPGTGEGQRRVLAIMDEGKSLRAASDDLRFASAVASMGMILRDSRYAESLDLSDVIKLADSATGSDNEGYRGEFVNLAKKAKGMR